MQCGSGISAAERFRRPLAAKPLDFGALDPADFGRIERARLKRRGEIIRCRCARVPAILDGHGHHRHGGRFEAFRKSHHAICCFFSRLIGDGLHRLGSVFPQHLRHGLVPERCRHSERRLSGKCRRIHDCAVREQPLRHVQVAAGRGEPQRPPEQRVALIDHARRVPAGCGFNDSRQQVFVPRGRRCRTRGPRTAKPADVARVNHPSHVRQISRPECHACPSVAHEPAGIALADQPPHRRQIVGPDRRHQPIVHTLLGHADAVLAQPRPHRLGSFGSRCVQHLRRQPCEIRSLFQQQFRDFHGAARDRRSHAQFARLRIGFHARLQQRLHRGHTPSGHRFRQRMLALRTDVRAVCDQQPHKARVSGPRSRDERRLVACRIVSHGIENWRHQRVGPPGVAQQGLHRLGISGGHGCGEGIVFGSGRQLCEHRTLQQHRQQDAREVPQAGVKGHEHLHWKSEAALRCDVIVEESADNGKTGAERRDNNSPG